MKKYVFKSIKTLKGFYIYDRSYNRVFRVNEEEFKEFCKVENNTINEEDSLVIQKYSQAGTLGIAGYTAVQFALCLLRLFWKL